MISVKNRFRGRHSLDPVYKRGKSIKTETMGLKYVPSRRNEYRLAVVVSKKISKSAVVRNRIRRRIYECVRKMHKDKPLSPTDMIITVYDVSIASMETVKLDRIIKTLLAKIT